MEESVAAVNPVRSINESMDIGSCARACQSVWYLGSLLFGVLNNGATGQLGASRRSRKVC